MPTLLSIPTCARCEWYQGWPSAWSVGVALVLPLMLACGSESLRPPAERDRADLYWDLELNHHAVTLSTTAPYDTLQLVAAPRNFRDEPLAGLPEAQYVSTAPERVIVTTDGKLLAVAPTTQPVAVVATLVANNLKHTDTVLVGVVTNPTPPMLASFSIHPVPPDSAKVSGTPGGFAFIQPYDTLWVRAATVTGDPIPVYGQDPVGVVPVYFHSSDTTVAAINSGMGELRGFMQGTVTIVASTIAFGVAKADTLEYRIGLPVYSTVQFRHDKDGPYQIDQPDIAIGLGGAVLWAAGAVTDTIDVTFTDADLSRVEAIRPVVDRFAMFNPYIAYVLCAFDCDNGGNFAFTPSQPAVGRYFPVPGTYEYRSIKTGLSGRIVVVQE